MAAIREPAHEHARQTRARRTTGTGRPTPRGIPFGARRTPRAVVRPQGLMTRMEFHKWRMKHTFDFEKIENWKNSRNGQVEYVGVYVTKTKQRARITLARDEVEMLRKKLHLRRLTNNAMSAAVANPHFLKEGVDFLVKLALHI